MTPKEKAQEIIMKMSFETHAYNAKHCALIAVQEIICSNPHSNPLNTDVTSTMKWWMDVQKEIEKL